MAGNFNISYTFNARDNFTRVGRRITQSVNNLGSSARRIPRALSNATRSLNPFRRGLRQTQQQSDTLRGSIKGLVGGFIGFQAVKGAINVGADFQTSMADLNAITGATTETMAFLREESFRLAKSAVVDQAKVATAFKLVASAKSELLEDPKGLSKVTESVLLLANAAGLDMQTATLAAVGALNQFNKGAKDADKFVNILAASQAVGASEVGELTQALKVSGKIASLTGLSFEQTNAALQVLAKSNIKGSEAGTGLKNALVKLDILMGKMGPGTIGLAKSLELVKEQNLTGSKATQLFGAEAATAILVLADGIPTFNRFTELMTDTNEATRQADAKLDTFTKRFEKLFIIIKGKIIRVFLKLEPTLSKLTNRVTKFFDNISPEDIDKFVDGIKRLIDVFVKKMEPTIKKVSDNFEKFFSDEGVSSTTDFITSLERIISVVETIATAFRVLFNIIGGIGEVLGQLAGAILTFDFSAFDFKRIKEAFFGGLIDADVEVKPKIKAPEKPKFKFLEQPLFFKLKKPEMEPVKKSLFDPGFDFLGSLPTGDSLNARDIRQTVENELNITVAAEKGSQVKAIIGTKGNGMRLGKSMEAAI